MTDTPRRRPPLPTREGTLKIKPRADAAPAAEPAMPDRRKAASGRNRGKASHPDQAQADPRQERATTPREPRGDGPRRDDSRRDDFRRDDNRRDDNRQDGWRERSSSQQERPRRPAAEGYPSDRPRRPAAEGQSQDRPRRAAGEGYASERPRRPAAESSSQDRPRRPAGEGYASERPRRPAAEGAPQDRPRRATGDTPPRHERRTGNGEPRPAQAPSPLGADGSIRLSKRMTELGLCSRREADEYIEKGWVRVDGRVVSELGSRVKPGQVVELDRRGQTAQDRRVTILLNKPVGYVSGQAEDGYEPASVLITAENRWAEDPSETRYLNTHHRGLAPAGRLDIDSIGLLVFTQDGRVARSLIGDDSSIEKEYHVRVEGRLDEAGLKLLNHGLSLDGTALRPAKVSWLNEDQLRFVLREGKKRQIRRMCELVGLKVVGLKRVRIGRVMLGNLPPGQWRYLGPHESF